MNLGWMEMVAIVGIALLFFGPSRLPGLGKAMGESIRGFKKGLSGKEDPHPTRDVNETLTHEDQGHQSGQSVKKDDKQRQS